MIRHLNNSASTRPLDTFRAETAIAYYATAAREHPAAKRAAFKRRTWRDDLTLGDRLHAVSAARRLALASDVAQAVADLREGVTP